MSTRKTDHLSAWTGPGAEAFKLWISFWPVAPFFGVEWRFAGSFPMLPMTPATPLSTKTETPMPAAKPAPEPTLAPVASLEPTGAVLPAAPDAGAMADAAEAAVVAFERVTQPAPVVESPAEAETADGPVGVEPSNLLSAQPDQVDDLQMIKGIGPSLEGKLNALGIYRFDQIAAFSDENLVWVDDQLVTFKGRCFRDDWVGQAKGLIG